MPETETPATNPPTPLTPTNTHAFTLGFLTILQDASGVFGGYLVTNSWGRPLEFRLSTAVQPNKVQQILYGPTLLEYLHADLIGKTLIERTTTPPTLIITDSALALALRSRGNWPILALAEAITDEAEVTKLESPNCAQALYYLSRYVDDEPRLQELLSHVDSSVDLAEPFARVREAVLEARKQGASRAA